MNEARRIGQAVRAAVSVPRHAVLGLAAAGVVLSACGGSGGGSSAASTSAGGRPGAAPSPAARFVVGRWHGELSQHGLAPFQITVTVRSLTTSASNLVHYGGINCGGHWTYLGTSGAMVRFREVIDSGKSASCKGVGEITLAREGDRLRYQFSGGGVISRGLLSRG